MTEREWLACDDLGKLVRALRGKTTFRRRILFGCGCVRSLHPELVLHRPNLRSWVEVAERYADGEASDVEYSDAMLFQRTDEAYTPTSWGEVTVGSVAWAWLRQAWQTAANEARPEAVPVLRDVFRPYPHELPAAVLGWEERTAPRLAEAIYAERGFDRLPILADALEEAGYSDALLLEHLRSPGPHVRGCWALDLVLGKV